MTKESKRELWKFADWVFLAGIGYLTYKTNPALGTLAMMVATCRYFRNDKPLKSDEIGD